MLSMVQEINHRGAKNSVAATLRLAATGKFDSHSAEEGAIFCPCQFDVGRLIMYFQFLGYNLIKGLYLTD